MGNNTIKTRIQLKNDTETNWRKAQAFRPLPGELIIYSTDAAHPFSRLKVGDGVTTVTQLPFVGATIYAETTDYFRSIPTFIPEKGDIIVFLDGAIVDDESVPKIKIGDGTTYNLDLPFVGDEIIAQLVNHINDTNKHITSSERNFWNNKINVYETVEEETLVFNRR